MSTAVTETAQAPAETPPDVRGPTSALPLSLFVTGALALALALVGTFVLQVAWAIEGGSLTPECRAAGLELNQSVGARGVCNVITALRSSAETTLLAVALVLGGVAIVAGWIIYRWMDTRRKRDHAIAGAVLGMQAGLGGAVFLWVPAGDLLFS